MQVYLIRNEEGYYKIGRTKRPIKNRLKELQTGSATQLEIVEVCKCKHAATIENILHRRYRSYRVCGEWFDLNEDVIHNFNKEIRKIEYSLENLKQNVFVTKILG